MPSMRVTSGPGVPTGGSLPHATASNEHLPPQTNASTYCTRQQRSNAISGVSIPNVPARFPEKFWATRDFFGRPNRRLTSQSRSGRKNTSPAGRGRRAQARRVRVTSRRVSFGYLEASALAVTSACGSLAQASCRVTLTCPAGILSQRERSFRSALARTARRSVAGSSSCALAGNSLSRTAAREIRASVGYDGT